MCVCLFVCLFVCLVGWFFVWLCYCVCVWERKWVRWWCYISVTVCVCGVVLELRKQKKKKREGGDGGEEVDTTEWLCGEELKSGSDYFLRQSRVFSGWIVLLLTPFQMPTVLRFLPYAMVFFFSFQNVFDRVNYAYLVVQSFFQRLCLNAWKRQRD